MMLQLTNEFEPVRAEYENRIMEVVCEEGEQEE